MFLSKCGKLYYKSETDSLFKARDLTCFSAVTMGLAQKLIGFYDFLSTYM